MLKDIGELTKGAVIEFPVTFDLKVIMDRSFPDEENRACLRELLKRLGILNSGWGEKLSKEEKYISFTVGVRLMDRPQMDLLYEELKKEPSVRFAL